MSPEVLVSLIRQTIREELRSALAGRPDDGLIGLPELARRLGISPRTLRRWAAQGRVPPPTRGPSGRLMWPASVIADHGRQAQKKGGAQR